MGIVFLSANAHADQLGDPFVGHFAKHTIQYLILATAALLSGGVIVIFGGPERDRAARPGGLRAEGEPGKKAPAP